VLAMLRAYRLNWGLTKYILAAADAEIWGG
jgi:hypothetical protein